MVDGILGLPYKVQLHLPYKSRSYMRHSLTDYVTSTVDSNMCNYRISMLITEIKPRFGKIEDTCEWQ